MKRWHKFSLFLAGAVAAGVALVYVARDREPSYHDRSLSDWLVALADHSRDGDPEQAEEAIRQIGTNAIPFLVRYGGYTRSSARVRLAETISGLGHWLGCDWGGSWRRTEARRDAALEALGILGTNAASKIPELTRLMNSPGDFEQAKLATFALGRLGPEALPPLMTALTNPQSPMRGMAALSLSLLGTNALPAVPILMGYSQDTNALAKCAAESLRKLQQAAQLDIPASPGTLEDR